MAAMMGGFTTVVTILRGTPVASQYSTAGRLDWSSPEEIPVKQPVSLQPMSSSEESPDRPTVTTRWSLLSRPGHDIPLRPQDRVRVDSLGLVLSVDGEVGRWPHPTRIGAIHHIEATLERVEG